MGVFIVLGFFILVGYLATLLVTFFTNKQKEISNETNRTDSTRT